MGWGWLGWGQQIDSRSGAGDDEREAERVIAAIFSPAHSAAKKSADTDGAVLRRTGVRLFKNGEMTPGAEAGTGVEKKGDQTNWCDMPSSPIVGYVLRKEGLVDELVRPPRVLDSRDVRRLIAELASIEQKAQYVVDEQLPLQVHNRGRRGMELLVNPCLYAWGLYLMFWKAPRLYFGASPRDSVFFTRVLSLLRWSLPETQKEQIARRHRRMLQASNARVTLSFLSGCVVTSVAFFTHPSFNAMDIGPDVDLGKQSVAFQKHSEEGLRWLWYVYYHHPAYRSITRGVPNA